MKPVRIVVERGDITAVDAEVLALKYAQSFHGADKALADALGSAAAGLGPAVGQHHFVRTLGKVRAARALLVGTSASLDARDVRELARRMLAILVTEAPSAKHVALTVHGPDRGLDLATSLTSTLAGLCDALDGGLAPPELEQLTLVEKVAERALALRALLDERLPDGSYPLRSGPVGGIRLVRDAGSPLAPVVTRPFAFVAMSSSRDRDDIFHYALQKPLRELGLSCERAEQGSFTDGQRRGIESAAVVIADLTDAPSSLFLQLGYAWGQGRPTVLVARIGQPLPVDLHRERCLGYDRIQDLEEGLRAELASLRALGVL